ncbi:MAG: M43 family zinc metalloprotease, partial [Flavobacteriales bacterium]
MIRNFIPVILVLSSLASMAQYRCGTDIENNKNRARNPFLVAAQDHYNELMRAEMMNLQTNRDGDLEAVLTLPLVFHILHLDGPENISDAQILDAVEVLNRDYAKLNPDTINIVHGFDTIAANCRIQFKLATKDPLGNCTNGIERIRTIETLQGDNGSKLNQWPRERYINVWSVARINSGAAGYSQYPSSVIDQESARADGVLIKHDYLGRIGTGVDFKSRALTHEIGHFLDLAHLWGNTNEPEVACGEDGVDDTPVTEGHSSCALNDFSCSAAQNSLNAFVYDFSAVTANSNFLTDVTPAPAFPIAGESFPRVSGSEFSAIGVGITSVVDSMFAFNSWGSGAPNNAIEPSQFNGQIDTDKYY